MVSSEDENEGGNTVNSKANTNSGTANPVEAKVINGYAKQKATDGVALPSTAKYSKIWIYLRPNFSC
ncbi:hypothetical protein MAM1_0058c03687 [Mucor ambiguus]|uniref:Uncharacterized protein n=1 Tax=Mucor ambiguus TaxID=91626 RepID=A0A0C9MM80_9FUNG|nr:hypothetical protein MAM1_0058c03687 [Mucor ambiguus]